MSMDNDQEVQQMVLDMSKAIKSASIDLQDCLDRQGFFEAMNGVKRREEILDFVFDRTVEWHHMGCVIFVTGGVGSFGAVQRLRRCMGTQLTFNAMMVHHEMNGLVSLDALGLKRDFCIIVDDCISFDSKEKLQRELLDPMVLFITGLNNTIKLHEKQALTLSNFMSALIRRRMAYRKPTIISVSCQCDHISRNEDIFGSEIVSLASAVQNRANMLNLESLNDLRVCRIHLS